MLWGKKKIYIYIYTCEVVMEVIYLLGNKSLQFLSITPLLAFGLLRFGWMRLSNQVLDCWKVVGSSTS